MQIVLTSIQNKCFKILLTVDVKKAINIRSLPDGCG